MSERCQYCETPYCGDTDENGKPYCACEGAEIERLRARIAELEAAAGLFLEYCDYTSDPDEDPDEAAKGLWEAYTDAEKAARLVLAPEAE